MYTRYREVINELFAERSVGIADRPTDLSANERSVGERSVGRLKGPWGTFFLIFSAERSVGDFRHIAAKNAIIATKTR